MQTIPGYTVAEILHDQGSALVRATSGERRVLLRALATGARRAEEQSRVRYGCKLGLSLSVNGVLRAERVEQHGDAIVVVLEDFDGSLLCHLLEDGPLELVAALHIAQGLGRTLAELHGKGVVHRSVAPSNVLVSADRAQVKLTHLDDASRLERSARADLRALGEILYEMLTGKAPSGALPEPPHLVRPTFPRAVSDVVVKLLSNSAEDRYQSAAGLLADLKECLIQFQTTGTITDFVLGAEDAAPRFHAPDRLYGREPEQAELAAIVERVSVGETRLVILSGEAGIGKTALALEAAPMIRALGGIFAQGKFDPLASAPYSAFREAMEALVAQTLTEPEDAIAALRAEITRATDGLSAALIQVMPEVAPILGDAPPAPPLDPVLAERRFRLVFPRFLQAFTRKDRPIALFLDDLQWADPSSLDLLLLLATDPESAHLLLLGATREPLHALHGEAREIALTPLAQASVERLLGAAIGRTDDACRDLARLLLATTLGNPLFLQHRLSALFSRELLSFAPDQGRFDVRLETIRRAFPDAPLVDLLAEDIQRLPEPSLRAARMASCLGSSFLVGPLARALGQSEEDTALDLWEAGARGLILPIGDGYKSLHGGAPPGGFARPPRVAYAFSHDLLQEATYASIPVAERGANHLQISRQTRAEADAGSRVFEAVGHALRAPRKDRAEDLWLAELCLSAGERALSMGAYASARVFLAAGTARLPEDGPAREATEGELAYRLHRYQAESELVMAPWDVALASVHRALAAARSRAEKVEIQSLYVRLAARHDRPSEALSALRAGLALHGLSLPEEEGLEAASRGELDRLDRQRATLGGRDIAELFEGTREAESPDQRALLSLLGRAFIDLGHARPSLRKLLSLALVNASLLGGVAAPSALGAMGYAVAFEDDPAAERLAELALAIAERSTDLEALAVLRFYLGAFVIPLRRPLRESLPPLRASYRDALLAGSLRYAGLAAAHGLFHRISLGEELYGLHESSAELRELFGRAGERDAAARIAVCQRAIRLLTRGIIPSSSSGDLDLEEGEATLARIERDPTMAALHHLLSLEIAFLFGEREVARDHAARAEQGEGAAALLGPLAEARLCLYQSLLLTASPEGARESAQRPLEERRTHLAHLAHLGHLERLAARCPASFAPSLLLASAEMARIAGRHGDAMDLYDRATDAAVQGELVLLHGLASELSASYYFGLGRLKIGRVYLADAQGTYARWGADALVRALEIRHEEMSPSPPSAAPASVAYAAAAAPELEAVIKASQAISAELALSPLLTTLCRALLETSLARRALVILKDPSPAVAAAERGDDGAVKAWMQPGDASARSDASDVPRAVLRHVERTREAVVLADAASAGPFQSDPLIQRTRPRSVLCAPILLRGALLGVAYLEHRQVSSLFTPERARAASILCAQAAISLENARRHGAMEDQRRAQADKAREDGEALAQALGRLKLLQKQLIMQEKLASLGALTSGIAHEIKNPLNFVNNFAELSISLARDLLEELDGQRARLDPSSLSFIEEVTRDLQQNAAKINEHGKRVDQIVRAMLEHSRASGGEPRDVDLNVLLKEYVALAYQGLRAQNPSFNVTIESSYDPALPPVKAIPQDLGRVFLNLINNACYAAFARKKELGDRFSPLLRVSTRALPGEAEIRVRDNGAGIPAAVREHIFGAFFTTKPPGEGTGLGLSISHEIIVQGNGGKITFETEEGQGTEFIVTLRSSAR